MRPGRETRRESAEFCLTVVIEPRQSNEETCSSLALQARSGTPVYMAPELFREGAVHSTASDLWALGCVVYECAAGRPPFVSGAPYSTP